MTDLTIFNNPQFGEIRTTQINGEIYFVGKDVATALGYVDTNKAIAMHVANSDKLNDKTALSLGQRGGWFISESGFYSLVFSSKMQQAQEFTHWVTSEVLPSIRKTGSYTLPRATAREEAMLNNSRARQAALLLRCAKETQIPLHKELLLRGAANIATGQEILPAIECNRTYSATEVAKNLGISANMVGKIANRLNLKQDGVYGNWCADTTRNLKKDVQVFRYNDKAVALIENELKRGASK